jgi:aminoacyl tRNA synthase complex-interacting multifunctional protein 1
MLCIDAHFSAFQKIDVGEEEPRIVCSGLVAYMKPEEIQDQTIVVVVRIGRPCRCYPG